MTSLRLRLLVGAAIWIGLALVGAGAGISWLLRDHLVRTFDARLDAFAVGLMAVLETDPATGAVNLSRIPVESNFARVGSGWYWQISDATGVRIKSRSLWTDDLAVGGALESGKRTVIEMNGPGTIPLRGLATDVTAPGDAAILRIVVAGPRSEIYENVERIERPLMIALVLLGLGLAAAVLIQITIGLRPFRELREQLADVRQGRRERLPERTLKEVAPLVAEVNSLLDHNAAVVARARIHAANLAHALKTPLSALAAVAPRAGGPHDSTIGETVTAIDRLLQHHLRRARAAGSAGLLGARVAVGPVLSDILTVMRKIYAERGIEVNATIAPDAIFSGERQDLEEMLGNLLDNAYKWAHGRIEFSASMTDGRLVLAIGDDGGGMSDKDYETALVPGTRLDTATPGHGFGLAIVRDLAELYRGTLTLGRSRLGGLEAVLRL